MKNQTRQHRIIIGITGRMGAGKSVVSKLFAGANGLHLDADKIAHQCLQLDNVRQRIKKVLGVGVFSQDGRLLRRRLANVIFQDPTARRKLEHIIHPDVVRICTARIDATIQTPIILDVPLLFESKMDRMVDFTVLVIAHEKKRLARLRASRKMTVAEIQRRWESQEQDSVRCKQVDFVIENHGGFRELRIQVRRVFDLMCLNRQNK